jgi:hypothetical protein
MFFIYFSDLFLLLGRGGLEPAASRFAGISSSAPDTVRKS